MIGLVRERQGLASTVLARKPAVDVLLIALCEAGREPAVRTTLHFRHEAIGTSWPTIGSTIQEKGAPSPSLRWPRADWRQCIERLITGFLRRYPGRQQKFISRRMARRLRDLVHDHARGS